MNSTRIGHRYRDAASGKALDVWFPRSNEAIERHCLAEKLGLIVGDFVTLSLPSPNRPPTSAEDVYLRLHLLSELAFRPNTLNLDGLFDLLNNVAWTSVGPVLPSRVPELRVKLQHVTHHLGIPSIDKFPRMTDYVVPEGVRIADADRVRLGAHLSPGTTVMHEGFVNFNAGTLGESMIEGRVTPGVVMGRNADVGAGASIMGTLSGGGKQVNSVGERSLIGANAGIGISLGDDCIVEAGLYVTAGSKVRTPGGKVVKARELSGMSGLLFRRNSQSGSIECVATDGRSWGGLNDDLHQSN
ncbi:DapH/DapD/GlmU-related protein [Aquabacterium sp. A7-Y]|uniref:DapH/DapD/GlmU-related protein n=1 Tax=Aquabacterium sp. A7-Y TaxID=1349605 RepID=UPI00223C9A6F|nr:DapH/DapD/GlmU-related protein [Aquabacterium sp. A7-Y]MCW7536411.1 DapH/DapD/GlmU-related protein [Aquabacterium sp. A7-Y]